MKIKGIKYIGPIFDGSGYGKACRGNINALFNAGIPLTLAPISFDAKKPTLGEDEAKLLEGLTNRDIEYNFVIIHSTPEFWERLREPGKINVGYTVWETSKLHRDWPDYINKNVDKVLVGCDWNVGVLRDSGVTIPIGVAPHGAKPSDFDNIKPFDIKGVGEDTYVFYDIFQWSERKNPMALLQSFWYAFRNNEDVALVLKTYMGDHSSEDQDRIKNMVGQVKKMTRFENYPKVFLVHELLSDNELKGLHARGDCYVSLDRGEGFGLGPFQAGQCNNPIIVTGWGGVTEYAKEDNSYLVNYQMTPVVGMGNNPWYTADQLWAEPDLEDAAKLMKHVYNNKDGAKNMGIQLRKYIEDNFTWDIIGKKIIKELEEMS